MKVKLTNIDKLKIKATMLESFGGTVSDHLHLTKEILWTIKYRLFLNIILNISNVILMNSNLDFYISLYKNSNENVSIWISLIICFIISKWVYNSLIINLILFILQHII